MPYYVIVNQSNRQTRCIGGDGREYWSIGHYVPNNVDEARALHSDSAHGCSELGVVKLVEADDRPSCPWGCGVYEYNSHGRNPVLIKGDWDSSG